MNKINSVFIKNNTTRGKCPIGVSYDITTNKYKSNCCNGEGKKINLGYFDDEISAFEVYKKYKEQLIKEIAIGYKEKIPNNVYSAMINYKIDVND